MTYIENIYLCLALPLLLSLFFIRGRSRRYALFLVIGMTVRTARRRPSRSRPCARKG